MVMIMTTNKNLDQTKRWHIASWQEKESRFEPVDLLTKRWFL